MKVRFLVSVASATHAYRAKRMYDLPPQAALRHIQARHAVAVEDEPTATALQAPENTRLPRARRRVIDGAA